MRKFWYVLLSLTVLFAIFGCYDTDMTDADREEVSFDMEGIKPLDVDLEFAIGKIMVSSGTEKLAHAKFAWNNDALKPEYSLTSKDDKYSLYIEHVGGNSSMKKAYSEWEIYLNNQVPINLSVECGVGESEIDLSDLDIESLDMDFGVGTATVDLRGKYSKNINANIGTGIGEVTIYLPTHMGIRVSVDKGLGDIEVKGLHETEDDVYENQLFRESGPKIKIDMSTGIGSVNLIAGPEEVAL